MQKMYYIYYHFEGFMFCCRNTEKYVYKYNLYYTYFWSLSASTHNISSICRQNRLYPLVYWLQKLTFSNSLLFSVFCVCMCVCVKIYCFETVNCVALNVKNAQRHSLFVWQSKSYWHGGKRRTLHNTILYLLLAGCLMRINICTNDGKCSRHEIQ